VRTFLARITASHILAATILIPSVAALGYSTEEAQYSLHQEQGDGTSMGAHRIFEGRIKHFGSELIPSQRSRNSLRLKQGTHAEVEPDAPLAAQGGAISFWVYPLWGKDDHASHTFVSLAWNEPRKSYLAITHGWWEPQGNNRFYFIVSNQDAIHCSTPYQLEREVWTMVTVVWKDGATGYCKLFVNDQNIAVLEQSFSGSFASNGPLYLGSDKGTTQSQGRSADALLDELTIYDSSLSEGNIKAIYRAQETNLAGATARKWKWLEDWLTVPKRVKQTTTGQALESRVMFDEDMHWAKSKADTDKTLKRIKSAGFNVYVPCVWHGNGTYYPTHVANQEPRLKDALAIYDPLAYLIERAHSMGIEVHPWFTVVRRENAQYPGFFGDGVPEGAYDAHNPEFRKFIVRLMLDVVERYDVDGINLDYIRTMGLCTSASCQENYSRATGENFWADYYLRGIMGPARNRLEKWQDDAVREIVENLGRLAKKIKPKLVISVDSHPKPKSESRPLDGRNDVGWINSELIDVIFAMDYREIIDHEAISKVRQDLRNPDGLIVLFGNYDRLSSKSPAMPRSGILVSKYASYAQRRWPSSGVAFYLYGQMSDEQVAALREGAFRDPAVPAWSNVKGP
jgi:uncharacterized lipoprotein YddW (UPF0748 family)